MTTQAATKYQITPEPYYLDDKGFWRFREHEGQRQMLASKKRFVLMLAGTQSGKTVSAPWWLCREIALCGPGDYLAVSPTYKLMQMKLLPEVIRLFSRRLNLGTYKAADRVFEFSSYGQAFLFGRTYDQPTQIFFGHAQDPDSLESATAKAAVLDEAGQKKFRRGSWEAILRRLSIHEGRVLLPTTPYTLGWLKSEVYDPATTGHPDYDLIQFDSTMNPAFPRREYDRARETLPAWKFNMMYRGLFERPAGMIYDCYDADNTCSPFTIPEAWPRYLGLDFGGVNTAGVFLAEELAEGGAKTGRFFAYRTYHAGSRTAKEHVEHLLQGEPRRPRSVGGAKSEGQWRDEFRASGLAVEEPPVSEVEVGIDRVYGVIKTNRIIFFDTLLDLGDELQSYSREIDEAGEPTERIEDKSAYHKLDALRYIVCELEHTRPQHSGRRAHIF